MLKFYLSQSLSHAAQQRHGFLRFWGLAKTFYFMTFINMSLSRLKKIGQTNEYKKQQPLVMVQVFKQKGFTLLEMLVVVGLLAVMSSLTLVAYDFSSQAAGADVGRPLAQAEMVEMAKAIRHFRADNRAYPEITHPADINWLVSFVDDIDNSDSSTNPDGLDDLYGVASWDIDTARGWRGPYLEQRGFAFVNISGLHADVADVNNQFAKPDPFVEGSNNATVVWTPCNDATPACAETLEQRGSPYLLFGFMDNDNDGVPDNLPRRIVSLGSDGVYGGTNVNNACSPNTAVPAGEDDLVLCI